MNVKELKVAFGQTNILQGDKPKRICDAKVITFYPFEELDQKNMFAIVGNATFSARYSTQLGMLELDITGKDDFQPSKNVVLVELKIPADTKAAFELGMFLGSI